MLWVRIKGVKHTFILRTQGDESAEEYVRKTAYLWSKFTLKIIGIELDVTGTENIPEEQCVFVGNHSSILDIIILLYTVNKKMGFIAKRELLKTPILGYC